MFILIITILFLFISLFLFLKKEKTFYLKYKNLIFPFWAALSLATINFFLKASHSIETFVSSINDISFLQFVIFIIIIEGLDFWKKRNK